MSLTKFLFLIKNRKLHLHRLDDLMDKDERVLSVWTRRPSLSVMSLNNGRKCRHGYQHFSMERTPQVVLFVQFKQFLVFLSFLAEHSFVNHIHDGRILIYSVSIRIISDGIRQLLLVVLFLNSRYHIVSVPAIDVLRATTCFLIDYSDNYVEHHVTHLFGLLACREQHADIEEGTEIKDA